jgi:hypothetical protein
MKIEFNDDCGLTDQERRQILRDALIEFMCNRLGYPEDMNLLRVSALTSTSMAATRARRRSGGRARCRR